MEWFKQLTASQWWAASRHYITFAFGIAGGIGLITVAQQHDAVGALDDISTGIAKIAAGIGTLLTIFGPIINGWVAAHKASPKEQMTAVVTQLSAPQVQQVANAVADPEGRNKLINAVAEMPEVKQVVAVSPVAQATSSTKVVAIGG